jgi:hypothetical protein
MELHGLKVVLWEVRLLKVGEPKYVDNDCHVLESGLGLIGSGEKMRVLVIVESFSNIIICGLQRDRKSRRFIVQWFL